MFQFAFSNEGQWFWQAISTIVVAVTFPFALWQLRLQRHAHVVASMESLLDAWDSREMLLARKRVCEKLLGNREYFGSDFGYVLEFFEHVGGYVRQGALPARVVWATFSWPAEVYASLARASIVAERSEYADELLWQDLDYLLHAVRRINFGRQARRSQLVSEALIAKFLDEEISTAAMLLELKEDR